MGSSTDHSTTSRVWRFAREQHGVVSRGQLVAVGLSEQAIQHRIANGRLHPVGRGVYAVGRSELTLKGQLRAATLTCGPRAVLSHRSAAVLWGIVAALQGRIDVSTPGSSRHRQEGITAHRRNLSEIDMTVRDGIPVTGIVRTLIDITCELADGSLERAINEADRLDLIDPEALRAALGDYRGQRGVGRLRNLLDRRTFRLTDSELERWFLPQVRRAGMPLPLTQQRLNGFKVDFYWPELRLVVETDGLRYHRTPAQQARDRLRDQAHLAAGFIPLRFTHWQVRYERDYVRGTLLAVARRLVGSASA